MLIFNFHHFCLLIFFFIFTFVPDSVSKTVITGGVITTQNVSEELDENSKYFYKPFNIKPPLKIEIDKSHLQKLITFNDAVHLERRIGIGAPANRVNRYIGLTRTQAIDIIMDELLHSKDEYSQPSWFESSTPINFMKSGFRGNHKNCYRKVINNQKKSLITLWTEQLITSNNPQFERLVLFWHNHFVVGFDGTYERSHAFANHLLRLRKNAKGNLRIFLKDTLTDPGMISYLNNDENFIENINENLGREFLELFTLGEGNYSEKDVKNLSTLLTGHSVHPISLKYEFVNGAATSKAWIVLGKKIRNLDEIIDLVLNHPSFSEFLIGKFFSEYISLEKPSQKSLDYLKYKFFKSNFEISTLFRSILQLPEFWASNNRLTLVKSPVDLFIGTARTLGSTGSAGGKILKIPLFMGQTGQNLIDPPNVAGWKGGLSWLDGNAIEKRNELLANLYPESFFKHDPDKEISKVMQKIKTSKIQLKKMESYKEKINNIFNKSHEEQLIVENMLINWIDKDFEADNHPSISISLNNMKLGDRYWDGYEYQIGISRKSNYNFIRIESNKCSPKCLDTFSSSFSKKTGTQVLKFAYPDGMRNHEGFASLSKKDKLLINRLYELTSVILSENNLFHVFNRNKNNKENWFEWLRNRHNILNVKRISNEPNKERFILINKTRKSITEMCFNLSLIANNYELNEKQINKFITTNIFEKHKNVEKLGINLNKLLISDIEILGSEEDIRKSLFHEAYQLK